MYIRVGTKSEKKTTLGLILSFNKKSRDVSIFGIKFRVEFSQKFRSDP